MDFSQGRNIKSLNDHEYNVWSKLNPEIDPAKWAYLCRKIGKMSSDEFNCIIALFDARNAVKNALKEHVKGLLGMWGHRN